MDQPPQEELDAHYGYVYRITNRRNGKVYIGQHKHKIGEPWLRYLGSGSAKRFQSIPKELKLKELICYSESPRELNRLEVIAVLTARMAGVSLYNRSTGGIVGTYSAIKKKFRCSDREVLRLLQEDEHDWDQMALQWRRDKDQRAARRRDRLTHP